jgi:hypothetical protein
MLERLGCRASPRLDFPNRVQLAVPAALMDNPHAAGCLPDLRRRPDLRRTQSANYPNLPKSATAGDAA